jgi:hypothetical protein
MRITIKYEASWRNSFLDGTNNEALPRNGREFVGSMTTLRKRDSEGCYPNFIKRDITHDTVMGILNRLIGDQRKLYQSRHCPNYFFADLEPHITFKDQQEYGAPTSEVVYIRNMTGNTDQNSFTGMISANDPVFNSDYSSAFWGVLVLHIESLCDFIVDTGYKIQCSEQFDPFGVLQKLGKLNKLKAIDLESVQKAVETLQKQFPDVAYRITDGKIKPIELYCSALYLQIFRLKEEGHDISKALTNKSGIAGISKRGFTPKDFMDRYTTGSKKPIWGNPFQLKEKRKGEGEVVSQLTKANGTLDINLDISDEKAQQLKNMIDTAGVSSFYLGKKGLAYVDVIR